MAYCSLRTIKNLAGMGEKTDSISIPTGHEGNTADVVASTVNNHFGAICINVGLTLQ